MWYSFLFSCYLAQQYLFSGTILGTLQARVPGNPNVVITYGATSGQTLRVLSNGTVLLDRPLDREVGPRGRRVGGGVSWNSVVAALLAPSLYLAIYMYIEIHTF